MVGSLAVFINPGNQLLRHRTSACLAKGLEAGRSPAYSLPLPAASRSISSLA